MSASRRTVFRTVFRTLFRTLAATVPALVCAAVATGPAHAAIEDRQPTEVPGRGRAECPTCRAGQECQRHLV